MPEASVIASQSVFRAAFPSLTAFGKDTAKSSGDRTAMLFPTLSRATNGTMLKSPPKVNTLNSPGLPRLTCSLKRSCNTEIAGMLMEWDATFTGNDKSKDPAAGAVCREPTEGLVYSQIPALDA